MIPTRIDHLFAIPHSHAAPLDAIGAKALSLQCIAASGLPVPPALVIPTGFFAPWFTQLQSSADWLAYRSAAPAQWPALCAALERAALALPCSPSQQLVLDELANRLAQGMVRRFAVRSSAPEEDGGSASFAGLYVTELGVAPAELNVAIRRCFAACLAHRVAAYKAAHGMDLDRHGIAVIVQEQLDSDVAGVGFSINPGNNDYDEVVVDANWGLGESVVSGTVAPDHFVLDKTGGTLIARRLGAKQHAIVLSAGAGTEPAQHRQSDQYCLDEAQLRQLAAAIGRLEVHFGYPVDVEWAFAQGTLFILQVRPVTAYVPLPDAMLSAPGARRLLYLDIALSKGMTSNAAISPITLDWLARDIDNIVEHSIGRAAVNTGSPHGLLFLGGARMYLNLSNLLRFSSPARLAKGCAPTDQLAADILAGIDVQRYRAAQRPAWIWPALRVTPAALWRLRRPAWRAVRAVCAPHSTHRLYAAEQRTFQAQYAALSDEALPLDQFQRLHGVPAMAHIMDKDMPALAVGVLAMGLARRLARKDSGVEQELAGRLTRGITGNLVVDMGMRLFKMANMLGAGAFDDLNALRARIEKRQLPDPFHAAWDAFMHKYGCRGPGEMELANARYGDDPLLVLRQMAGMAGGGSFDPVAHHRDLVVQRQTAFESLLARFAWPRRMLLQRAHLLIELFGGARDTPKQHNLMYQYAARKRLLAEGDRLAAAGRLASANQVFDLTVADLLAAAADPALDVRALATRRTAFARKLAAHVRTFPAVIDSRGRIEHAPPRSDREGELRGLAVSPGVASGRIKLMANAHDRQVCAGDILVAYTTDPGWTPLFIHAAAIIIEVGGVLQHGAVLAREFGKPCVAGIAGVLTRFADGQLVEVDGNTGVVRLLSEPDHNTTARTDQQPEAPACIEKTRHTTW